MANSGPMKLAYLALSEGTANKPFQPFHSLPTENQRHLLLLLACICEAEAIRRFGTHGVAAVDDDEKLLADEETEQLEVAHIIPHALTSSNDGQIILVRSILVIGDRN